MSYRVLQSATFVSLFVITVSLALQDASAQGGHMQMGDSMNVTTTRGNQSSPAIYEIPDSGVQVKLSWQPEAISINETTTFTFEFIDTATQQRLQSVSYAVHILLDGRGMGTAHAHEATAPEGIGTVEQEFDSTGSLAIIVESIRIGNDTPVQGVAQFNVAVAPEFHVAGVIIMGAALSSIIAAARLKTKRP
jgi:hypothetical protein